MGPAVCSGRATDDSRFPLAQLEGHPSRAGETLAMGCTLVRSALHTFGLPTLPVCRLMGPPDGLNLQAHGTTGFS